MMTDQEVTQKQYEKLLEDVGYLGDEAEALQYVIDRVPHSEDPPEGRSIYSTLKLIDHAQVNYFRPIIEQIFAQNRLLDLSELEEYEDTFEEEDKEERDIQKALRKIVKHRAALLNVVKKIPLIDWERGVKNRQGHIITLYDFVQGMIREERKHLKEIADLILVYQNEKMAQKEINAKANQRKSN
ncbi:hypothetical protein [Rhodohalobacter halophilus]|uniref:hypothetical protein n=1 Tax=Rhodohalobacter halophilus TaxID=1812810 RepID=UPI001FE21A88|nr:hypothetical protein [Rhodohalobacter halophilus]